MTRISTALTAAVVALLCAPAVSTGAASPTVPASLCNFGKAPTLSSQVPADATTNQASLNCFAWQEFIALNWKADPSTCAADPEASASTFGEPGSAAVVWETFKTSSAVFLRDAVKPPGWCSGQPAAKSLSALNKFSDVGEVDLSEIAQTNPQNSWLTAQSGLLTLYEVRINEDEFNYVFTNTLYDAQKQRDLAASDAGLSLPDGGPGSSQYGPVGAIELKAAWLELDDRKDWPRYKTAKARVSYPGQSPKVVTVGLVALHIIHKTQSAQQFVWATFEHVDNDPSADEKPDPRRTYTFFDPACDPQADHYKCVANAVPDTPCKPDGQPQGCDPYDAPVQVRRTTPINDSPTNDIVGLNRAVQSMIAGANSDSVFAHYELVNVLWPDNSTKIAPKSQVPLTCGDPTPPPSQEIVSNTIIETYLQAGTGTGDAKDPDPCNANATGFSGDTCLTCHVSATVSSKEPKVSPKLVVGTQDQYASDYSFVLSKAFAAPAQEGDGGTPVGWIALGLGGVAAAAAGAVALRRRRSAADGSA